MKLNFSTDLCLNTLAINEDKVAIKLFKKISGLISSEVKSLLHLT